MDKQELITELGKLSPTDAAQVIAEARKNDQRQRMEAGAAAMRQYVSLGLVMRLFERVHIWRV